MTDTTLLPSLVIKYERRPWHTHRPYSTPPAPVSGGK
jgi:hypothetical protein